MATDPISTPIFVGRREELQKFDEILRDPGPRVVVVVGPPGMGKTWLVEQMMRAAENHPDLTCGAVRYEVTPDQTPDSILELMLDHAYDAAAMEPGSRAPTDQRRKQWRALFEAVVPKGDKLANLALSLKRDPAKNTRDQFIDRIQLVANALPENGRAVFVIDPEKYMAPDSDQAWAIVAARLPPKVKLLFAQRPEDVLVKSQPFNALDGLVKIPGDGLEALDQDAIDELINARAPEVGLAPDVLRDAVGKYKGHPYAVDAALKLIQAGTPPDAVPSDPHDVAADQWTKACETDERAIALFEAYAILEVAVPDDVVGAVSGLNAGGRKHVLANPFMAGLLRGEAEGRRIYHAILADCIYNQIDPGDADKYQERAIKTYRARLNADVKPDALAAQRLPEHVLAAEGKEAFVTCFINECGEALKNLGLLDAFIAYTGRALSIVERGSAHQAMLLGNLGTVYRTRGDLDKAEEMHKKSLQIEKKLGRLEGMASDYGNLGIVYGERGDLDKAEEMFNKSLEIEKKLGRLEGMASDYGNLGLIYETRGDLDKAEEMYKKSLEINKKLGRLEGMASNYGNLGNIYYKRGDLDKAEEMHKKSLEIEKKLGRLEGMASDYGNLGVVYGERGDLDKAEEMFNKSLEIDEKLGRLEGMASDYGNLGLVYETRGDLDKAEEMHKKSLEIEKKLGRLEGMANAYGNLGGVCEARGDVAGARKYWTQARDLFAEIGIDHMADKVQDWLESLGALDLRPETED